MEPDRLEPGFEGLCVLCCVVCLEASAATCHVRPMLSWPGGVQAPAWRGVDGWPAGGQDS